jgi:hypothetical protein
LTSSFDTGSSVAALNKELTATMHRALKDVILGVDPLDELRVHRLQGHRQLSLRTREGNRCRGARFSAHLASAAVQASQGKCGF